MQSTAREETTDHQFGNKLDSTSYVDRPGETAVEALQREVLEEVGYEVSLIAEIGSAAEHVYAVGEEMYCAQRDSHPMQIHRLRERPGTACSDRLFARVIQDDPQNCRSRT